MLSLALLVAGTLAAGDSVPLYTNLGTHHYAITTRIPAAQRYFDQGLRLYYAFNHAEAIRAFREAQRLDPACAMCFWGEALALGPNINAPMDPSAVAGAVSAVTSAARLQARATPTERALIGALKARYSADSTVPRPALDSAYARAMADAARRFPADAEVATLHAEALMDLRPWSYWVRGEADGVTTYTLADGMAPALERLTRLVEQAPQHPGACHFYIHLVEAAYPERAVACAERLAALMPGAGHLVHMPGHIYIRVGRYVDAIHANEHAVHADESYITDQRPAAGIYTLGYYPHNYDFLAFAALMAGREEQALAAADKLTELAVPHYLEDGMAFTQSHGTRALQMRVRFGRWAEVLATPAPDAAAVHARAIWDYATGRALVATGRATEAEPHLAALRQAAADPRVQGLRLEFNESDDLLKLASEVLAGVVASGEGQHDDAVAHLKEAVRLEDALTYGEPPEWSIPVRQDLGEVLMKAGRYGEAVRAYEGDLRIFPGNAWSSRAVEEARRRAGGR